MKIRIQLLKNVLLLYSLLALISCSNPSIKKQTQNVSKDSISIWVKSSSSKLLSLKQKKVYLKKAYKLLNSIRDDKSKAKKLSSIAYRYYELNDTLLFQQINTKAQLLAYKLKDSFTIADTHWSLADYFNHRKIHDKSYFHYDTAYKYFNGIKKQYETARMLYAMAYIKGLYRDYSGSEVLNVKAIEKFKLLKNYKYLYTAYNHLAILQIDIKEYDKSLLYHNKALEYYHKINNKKKHYLGSFNNIGNVYFLKKKYKKAIYYYNKELKDNPNINSTNLARVICNKAYCKLKMLDTINVKNQLHKSLKIRDSVKDKIGILTSKIYLSDYYKQINDTVKAINYANEANTLATKLKNGADYLTSLKQLADLKPKKSKQYLERYIQFNDSLINSERKAQEKFTKIAFETDEYIEETKRLSQQTIIISITGVGLLLILSLIYFLKVQKSKNEKLVLEAEQQQANEQVYLLTLEQQAIIEEERVQERNRISEELHDGVLGRLFGTRVGLGFLDLDDSKETQQQHESFLEELQEIEKEIRDVSHKLNANFNSEQINFTTLINQLLKTSSTTGSFKYKVSFAKEILWKDINQIIKINIYRIVQESLQNIVKYAQAKNVILDFSLDKENLRLNITDNGVGFNLKNAKKGIGIKNMKSRVQKLNGTLEIQSEIKKGTSIYIEIPIEN